MHSHALRLQLFCLPAVCLTPWAAAASDPLAREQLFMALWTLKESVVKARGTGINAPPGLRGFSIAGENIQRPAMNKTP